MGGLGFFLGCIDGRRRAFLPLAYSRFATRSVNPRAALVRIAISQAAFDAIASTLPLGSVGYEAEAALHGPGESYSAVILRIAKAEGRRERRAER